jgi:signal transduction histidine kinase
MLDAAHSAQCKALRKGVAEAVKVKTQLEGAATELKTAQKRVGANTDAAKAALASTVQKIHRIATHVGTTVGAELDGVAATKTEMLRKQLVEVNFAIENISSGTAVVNGLMDAGAPVSCES